RGRQLRPRASRDGGEWGIRMAEVARATGAVEHSQQDVDGGERRRRGGRPVPEGLVVRGQRGERDAIGGPLGKAVRTGGQEREACRSGVWIVRVARDRRRALLSCPVTGECPAGSTC